MSAPIDVEAVPEAQEMKQPTMALERRQDQTVGRALSPKELHERLEFIRQVMRDEMKEKVDYGKIPGCGDKPSLLQPGAQKLLMTFNLRAQVQRETLRELPHPDVFGHREYEFTIRIFPNGADPNREGTDGVGTCSTFESKYRYRKAERKCPKCGKSTIIAGKEEYGGGFLCWKRKGGCGEKFASDDPRIVNQSADDVENEDPADSWNTVRKMGFKRALVAGVINFTNTSELWTQDLEDLAANAAARGKPPMEDKPVTAKPPSRSAPANPAAAKPATTETLGGPPLKLATAATRAWMMKGLDSCRDLATEYFQKLDKPAVLLPTEPLEDLPWEWVPITKNQLALLKAAITDFGNGSPAVHPYAPNPVQPDLAEAQKKKRQPKAEATKPTPTAEAPKTKPRDPEWFWDVICPIPCKGMKKAEYDRKPDTVGSLYQAIKEGNQEAQRRLWGFANKWAPAPREANGRTYQPSEADKVFREALDAFLEWEQKHGKDTDAGPDQQPEDVPAGEAYQEDDVPF